LFEELEAPEKTFLLLALSVFTRVCRLGIKHGRSTELEAHAEIESTELQCAIYTC
jgi:hypothetical protein